MVSDMLEMGAEMGPSRVNALQKVNGVMRGNLFTFV